MSYLLSKKIGFNMSSAKKVVIKTNGPKCHPWANPTNFHMDVDFFVAAELKGFGMKNRFGLQLGRLSWFLEVVLFLLKKLGHDTKDLPSSKTDMNHPKSIKPKSNSEINILMVWKNIFKNIKLSLNPI